MTGIDLPLTPYVLSQLALALFFAMVFLQSAADKIFDWNGQLAWLTGHFAKSPLRSVVPALLGTLTVLELAAGVMSAVGFVMRLLDRGATAAAWGFALSTASLLALFFGQRMAKDYAGAAALVPYFLAAVLGLLIVR